MNTFTFPLLDLPPLPIETDVVGQGLTPGPTVEAQKPPKKATTQKAKRCDRCRQPFELAGIAATNFCEPCDRDSNPYYYVSEHSRILGLAANLLQDVEEILQESFSASVKAVSGTRQFQSKLTDKKGHHVRIPFFEIHFPDCELSVSQCKEIIRAAVTEAMGRYKITDHSIDVAHFTPTENLMRFSLMGLMEFISDDWNPLWTVIPKQ